MGYSLGLERGGLEWASQPYSAIGRAGPWVFLSRWTIGPWVQSHTRAQYWVVPRSLGQIIKSAKHRNRLLAVLLLSHCLTLDGHGVPKTLWAFKPSTLPLQFHPPALPPPRRRALQSARRHQKARRKLPSAGDQASAFCLGYSAFGLGGPAEPRFGRHRDSELGPRGEEPSRHGGVYG